jgi:Spy/CpxP family protein refolding chaperone
MRKMAVILGILMLATAFAVPAHAMGGGMGGGGMGGGGMGGGGLGGGGMTGNWGSGLLDWFQNWRNGSGYTNPPGLGRKQMQELDQQHHEDSAYLKYQIQMKERELDALLKSSDPDIEKVRSLHRDIRELRAEADQEERTYEREAGKMNSEYGSGDRNQWSSYGPSGGNGSRGMGYGGQMGDYGSGR